jgi:hypothetical protein
MSESKSAPDSASAEVLAFDRVWSHLENQGWCDGKGGSQYQRIVKIYAMHQLGLQQSQRQLTSKQIEALIRHEANCAPHAPAWCP